MKLATDPLATARLATTSARLGVPVDVAAWLALELVPRGAPDAGTLWDAAAGLSHRPDRQDQALRGWLDQLRRGTSFFEDELPYVWMPVRVICEAPASVVPQAVASAVDAPWLRAALDLECAAARTGRTAGAALDAAACSTERD